MNAGLDLATQIGSEPPAPLVSVEGTDHEGNSSIGLIGSLSAPTDNITLAALLDYRNINIKANFEKPPIPAFVDLSGDKNDGSGQGHLAITNLLPPNLFVAEAEMPAAPASEPASLLPTSLYEPLTEATAKAKMETESGEALGHGSEDLFAESDYDLTGGVELVSDYRFRGISYSDNDPAIQGWLEIEDKNGFYAGVWASSLKNVGPDVELDVYGGWRGDLGDFKMDIGGVAYVYPGIADTDYYEILASMSYAIGPVELKLGGAYAPSQSNLGDHDSFYGYGELSFGVPNTPLSLTAHTGREGGPLAGGTGRKWDWSLEAEYVLDKFTLGLAYVDTNRNRLLDPDKLAGKAVVASLKFEF